MGKLKDNYNKIKLTQRQMKKNGKKQIKERNILTMCSFLEQKWNNEINFYCNHCLQIAYESVLNNTQG